MYAIRLDIYSEDLTSLVPRFYDPGSLPAQGGRKGPGTTPPACILSIASGVFAAPRRPMSGRQGPSQPKPVPRSNGNDCRIGSTRPCDRPRTGLPQANLSRLAPPSPHDPPRRRCFDSNRRVAQSRADRNGPTRCLDPTDDGMPRRTGRVGPRTPRRRAMPGARTRSGRSRLAAMKLHFGQPLLSGIAIPCPPHRVPARGDSVPSSRGVATARGPGEAVMPSRRPASCSTPASCSRRFP